MKGGKLPNFVGMVHESQKLFFFAALLYLCAYMMAYVLRSLKKWNWTRGDIPFFIKCLNFSNTATTRFIYVSILTLPLIFLNKFLGLYVFPPPLTGIIVQIQWLIKNFSRHATFVFIWRIYWRTALRVVLLFTCMTEEVISGNNNWSNTVGLRDGSRKYDKHVCAYFFLSRGATAQIGPRAPLFGGL
jgi:hypothetical protein